MGALRRIAYTSRRVPREGFLKERSELNLNRRTGGMTWVQKSPSQEDGAAGIRAGGIQIVCWKLLFLEFLVQSQEAM